MRRLASKGVELFQDLFPRDLQEQLWSLRSRIASVQVQSDEPWIPWELCRLCTHEDDGRIVEGPFLSEAYAVTRWRPGLPQQLTLTLNNVALVVPKDSQLPYAPKERDYLLSLNSAERTVSPVRAGELEVLEALASGRYDGWHFSGHGSATAPGANGAIMLLEDSEVLTPSLLRGEPQNLGRTHPLVFLNACQLGQSAMSLTCIGGWADEFLNAGAGAFIGAYWSVDDTAAYDFAQALYDRLIIGVPIGRAVQEARTAIKAGDSSTWLAYMVFAAPLAVVKPACAAGR
jgi:hypothetical protein